jgi:predicted Ser/Thr protein kinase
MARETDDAATSPGDLEHRRIKHSVRLALFGRPSEPVEIGRFRVLRRLGAGGMGVVYSAYDDELDRKVAIKLVREDRAGGPTARQRLRREAQAAAKLSHPNVVSVFEVGEHDGRLFIAMEFVRGRTLRDWLAAAPRDWRAIRDVFVQAAAGLAAAHAEGLVHRDFKPDNVMLGDDGRVRVVDFGLAAFDDTVASGETITDEPPMPSRLTVTGELVGTPAYMAPEQRHGEIVDARSDQFSFCVTLWEALYDRLPFTSVAGVPDPPADRGVPAFIRDALRRGLDADPTRRFASMLELRHALARDPARRRRRVALTGVAILVAASAGYLLARPRQIAPPPGSEHGLVSDFEDGLSSQFGIGWQWSTDQLARGTSTVDFVWADEGAGGSAHALKIVGDLRGNRSGPRWAGAIFFPGAQPLGPANLAAKRTLRFWTRGDPGRYGLMVFTLRNQMAPTIHRFDVDRTWREHRVGLDDLEPDRHDLTGLFWGAVEGEGPFELWLDDVRLDP